MKEVRSHVLHCRLCFDLTRITCNSSEEVVPKESRTMSKVIVYILDKFVWLLLIAIFATQALQIAGVLETPKGPTLAEIRYKFDELRMQTNEDNVRVRRQAGDRSPLIGNFFNVPMSTLNAVNDFLQSTRPVIQRIMEAAQRRSETSTTSGPVKRQPKTIPEIEDSDGPEIQADGSSSRVLLRV